MRVDATSLLSTVTRTIGTQTYKKPIIETKSTTTLTRIKEGESVVMAGFISTSTGRDKSGLPFLSKVPLLSLIFGTDAKTDDRKELVIIATPKIVRVK